MARKRIKKKKYSCKLCKPGKTGQSNRWTPREQMLLKRFEQALSGGSDWNDQ
jgi:hypothetical protein